MTNGIYFDIYRDDESVSTWLEFSSRRSDFPDEVPSSSVYSTLGKTIRSWIRSPMSPPGSVQGEAHVGSNESNALGPPKIISLDELNMLTDYFSRMSLVGEGSYSQVFHATLSTGKAVAVRKLFIFSSEEPDFGFAAQLLKVSKLRHENFSGLMGYCLEGNNRISVHEFATMGSLHDILHGIKTSKGSEPAPVLTWDQRVKIAFGAARGLEYLHNEDIVHKSISSRNVFVFDDFV